MSARRPIVLDEKCGCGAEFHWIGEWPSAAQTAAREWREYHKHGSEAARNGPRNSERLEVAPEPTPAPVRNSDADSDLAGRAWETYANYALAHADDPEGYNGIEAMRAALKAIGVIQ